MLFFFSRQKYFSLEIDYIIIEFSNHLGILNIRFEKKTMYCVISTHMSDVFLLSWIHLKSFNFSCWLCLVKIFAICVYKKYYLVCFYIYIYILFVFLFGWRVERNNSKVPPIFLFTSSFSKFSFCCCFFLTVFLPQKFFI